jgi:hypothetical protein
VEVVIAIVRAHATQRDTWSQTVAPACVVLSSMLSDGDAVARRSAALFRDATRAVLTAMRAASDDAQVQRAACTALFTISAQPAQRAALCRAEGVMGALLTALRLHADDVDVQSYACKALFFVCNDNERNAAAAAAAIPSIVAVMRACDTHAEMQADACLVLAVIVNANPERQIAARAAGAVRAVVAAMQAHPRDAMAQFEGSRALVSLVFRSAASGDDAVDAGAIEAVLRWMDSDDAEVDMKYEYACVALEPLLQEGRDAAAHVARAVRAGALETLRQRRQPCTSAKFGEVGLARVLALLTDAAALHDRAACAHAGCKRCAANRAAGVVCALPGCGARRREADGDGGAKKRLLRCGACQTVAYCGAGHQRDDWARHKAECAALRAAAADAGAGAAAEQLP